MGNLPRQRQDLEGPVINLFEAIAHRYTTNTNRGNKEDNKVPGTKFQFGDLRVNTSNCHILVEVESGGGVTNLVKYWYCLKEHKINKPIKLLHIYGISTEGDFSSYLDLWNFLSSKMKDSLGDLFTAEIDIYWKPKPSENLKEKLASGLGKFERIVREEFIVTNDE
ncbi:MAG: hypothetical protein J2P36_01125 [Ktedonobacteraceae bacterium]|nr:hypothetical protein [Ktedonobacteraceae bacterium]